jgi:hypothetical protein
VRSRRAGFSHAAARSLIGVVTIVETVIMCPITASVSASIGQPYAEIIVQISRSGKARPAGDPAGFAGRQAAHPDQRTFLQQDISAAFPSRRPDLSPSPAAPGGT